MSSFDLWVPHGKKRNRESWWNIDTTLHWLIMTIVTMAQPCRLGTAAMAAFSKTAKDPNYDQNFESEPYFSKLLVFSLLGSFAKQPLKVWSFSYPKVTPVQTVMYMLMAQYTRFFVKYGYRWYRFWMFLSYVSRIAVRCSKALPNLSSSTRAPLGGVNCWSPGATIGRLGLLEMGFGSAFHRLSWPKAEFDKDVG